MRHLPFHSASVCQGPSPGGEVRGERGSMQKGLREFLAAQLKKNFFPMLFISLSNENSVKNRTRWVDILGAEF